MTVLSPDCWTLALAAVMAILASYVTLTIALRVSADRSRGWACRALFNSLLLGFGFWVANYVELLSIWPPSWPSVGFSDLIVPFVVAAAGQGCALLFLARREPEPSAIAGSAFALAAGIGAIHGATLDELPGHIAMSSEAYSVCIAFVFAFVVFSTAIWLWFKLRYSRRSWQSSAVRIAAVLAGATAILGTNALALINSSLAIGPCCQHPWLTGRLLAAGATAAGSAALTVALVLAICSAKLAQRASYHARDLAEVHARLQYLATHDLLTGLPNRQKFNDRMAESLGDAKRDGRAVAVAVLDIDRFSAINHSLGRGVGDWMLTELSRRIRAVIPNADTLARLGGDEFAILIDNVMGRAQAQSVTAAVLSSFDTPFLVNGIEVRVRPSIGASVWPEDGRSGDDLLAHAEAAMTVAKQRGGGEVLFFQPGMTDSMQERLALENDLRRALGAGEFEIYYQPEICTRTGRVASVEALLRWRHPTKGLIGPNSFISLAEETGLMIPLGEWVLREVCRQARAWQIELGSSVPLAVNLSATQFRHQNLLQVIRSALDDSGLAASALEIELTESALMPNAEEAAGVLKQLRKLGVCVAIDDFGTGYSSLSYLRRFPINKLKIDRSFIRDLTTSPTDESIVRAIVSLARSVGLQVVAEGIETAEQLEFVTALGCDQWQGYLCCPPESAALLEDMLRNQSTPRTRTSLAGK
jgi:diguanylate cyclase (GGDEF)-like protein